MAGTPRVTKRYLFGIVAAVILVAIDIYIGFALGWPLAIVACLAELGWGLVLAPRLMSGRDSARPAAVTSPAELAALERERGQADIARRLDAMLRLNRTFASAVADAIDERQLMDSALSTVTGLVGALGCSFVPVDEWQQPLPPFTFGQLPAPVLSAWSAHLATTMLRERCGACQVLESTPGACPLHPAQLGNSLTVYCLPLTQSQKENALSDPAASTKNVSPEGSMQTAQAAVNDPRTGQTLGVLHLYLPSGRSLERDSREFLESLLPEIALAYESTRMRSQEIVTMRQLQMLRSQEGDIPASLRNLLEGLKQAIQVDFILIRLRPSTNDQLSNLVIQDSEQAELPEQMVEALVDQALEGILRGEVVTSPSETTPAWIAMPLFLPEKAMAAGVSASGRLLGMMIAGTNRPYTFHPRQQAILETVAAQAALVIENEQLIRSLEYKMVIQERARLAREIHDGLAQTLAFLKLQAAQMQTYLAQGNLARLSQVLNDNYQVLAEAYLDTRQAIDNLRLTPQEGLETWIDRVLLEFERTTGIHAERYIQHLIHPVAPEVQAQLIRVVQEALGNIRKHSRAHHVQLSLLERADDLIIEVSDDGVGFEAEDIPEISQHGLRGMRERAEMIGADFQIVSKLHQGTKVRLTLPACQGEGSST